MEDNKDLNGETEEQRSDDELTGDPRKDVVVYGRNTRFSKDRQPDPEAKKQGWAKKLRNRKLAQMILNRRFVGKVVNNVNGQTTIVDSKFKQLVRQYFDLSEDELEDMSNEAAIMMRMIGNAIENGDNQSAALMLERAYGKPKELSPFEDPENEDDVEQKPTIVIQVVQSINLPNIEESENNGDNDEELQ